MEDNLEIFEIGFKERNSGSPCNFYSVYEKNRFSYTDEFGYLKMPREKGEWYAKVRVPNFPAITIDLSFEDADLILRDIKSCKENDINLTVSEIGYKKDQNFYSVFEKSNNSYTDIHGFDEMAEEKGDWYAKIDVSNNLSLNIDLPYKDADYILKRIFTNDDIDDTKDKEEKTSNKINKKSNTFQPNF